MSAHDPGVVLELRRLAHGDDWAIAPTLGSALSDLLSRPLYGCRLRGSAPWPAARVTRREGPTWAVRVLRLGPYGNPTPP